MTELDPKQLTGEILCDCYACGKSIAMLNDADGEPCALAHEPIDGVTLGPNGETGCDAFDVIGDNSDAVIDYLTTCREAAQRKRGN